MRRLLFSLVLATVIGLSPVETPRTRAAEPAPPVYSASLLEFGPNCGLTQIILYLRDANGAFISGERFRIETADGGWGANSYPTGSANYPPGGTDFVLRSEPMAMTWNLWPIDGGENKIGAPFQVTTDTADCKPGGAGHQVAWVQWVRGQQLQQPTVGTAAVGPAAPSADAAAVGTASAEGAAEPPKPAPEFPWLAAGLSWLPNCGLTQVIVYARDQEGRLVDGARFRIESATGPWSADSNPTGRDWQHRGVTDFILRGTAFANDWNLYAIDDAGNRTSPVLRITTDDRDCQPTGSGHQIAVTQFVKAQ